MEALATVALLQMARDPQFANAKAVDQYYQAHDPGNRRTVLFGSTWYSRSVSTLLEKTPWTLRWDEVSRQVVLVKQGTDGRKFLPRRGPRGEYQEVFGLVSVLPNHHSTDGDRTIVVFSGLTSVGTHGAAAFFTSGADLKQITSF